MCNVAPKAFHFEGFTLDLMRCALLHGGEEIVLRPKAFDVLRYLAEHAGRLITKDEIIHAVWLNVAVTDNSLVQCIVQIRAALNDSAGEIVKTVPWRGYLMAVKVRTAVDANASFAQLNWQQHGGRSMSAEIRRVLECACPGQEVRYFDPISIGDSSPVADAGAALILDGEKTTTSSAPWEFPDGRIPFVGALSVLLDGEGRARGIVETERVAITPFTAVNEHFVRAYWEASRTLEWWRSVIGAKYRASAARHGQGFSDNTPLICEWFTLVRRL